MDFFKKIRLRPRTILAIFGLVFLTIQVKADSWQDPAWIEMIYRSDVIALVEYSSGGDFRAMAKPLVIYKGELKSEEIWISGFSNRYGPIDSMSPGDRYLVFLRYNEPTERSLAYWQKQIKEDPELTTYYEAIKAGKTYHVWSPTAGDLKVKGEMVQYDLLQTTYYGLQSFYPLTEFETFLRATTQKENTEFYGQTLKKVRNNATKEITAQYLRMLYLTSYNSFVPTFITIADGQLPESCYALAQLLGRIQDEKSRDLLIQLLDHKNSIVQGEVVRQLANQDPQLIGPILLVHLDSAGIGGIYPSNIMDPVRNEIDGGKIEIIKTLGQIKYKPAAKALLPLLETEDDDLFKLVLDVLIQLDNRDFVPYLNEHLKNKTTSLLLDICQTITENDLKECKPALMDFITNHNRNVFNGYEYTISYYTGLAHFNDPETIDFLLKDFENMVINNDTLRSDALNDWTREYIETFKEMKNTDARPLIYKSLDKWFGLNYDFALHPELFEIKRNLEETINQKSLVSLNGDGIKKIETIVFLTNTEDYGPNFIPMYDQSILITLAYTTGFDSNGTDEIWTKLDAVREQLSKDLDIPVKKIGSRKSSYVSNIDDRFDNTIDWSPMIKFYKYAKALPSEQDLRFLKALAQNGFAKREFDIKQLEKTIKEIEVKLGK